MKQSDKFEKSILFLEQCVDELQNQCKERDKALLFIQEYFLNQCSQQDEEQCNETSAPSEFQLIMDKISEMESAFQQQLNALTSLEISQPPEFQEDVSEETLDIDDSEEEEEALQEEEEQYFNSALETEKELEEQKEDSFQLAHEAVQNQFFQNAVNLIPSSNNKPETENAVPVETTAPKQDSN